MASADEYRAYIEIVLGEMKGNATLALAADERRPNGALDIKFYRWFSYPEQLDEMVQFVVEHEDRDVYLSPLIYGTEPVIIKGKKWLRDREGNLQYSRSKTNALRSQTIYMDSDSCPPEKFRLPPSLHMDSSEGHGQDYWVLSEPVTATEAATLAHKITTAHQDDGTDPSGWSQNKVLRLPTVNTRYDQENPWPIEWSAPGHVYYYDDIAGVYDDVVVEPGAGDGNRAELGDAPSIDGLPDFQELVTRIPSTNRRLEELIFKTPARGEKGWQSEQRWALILDLFRFGFEPEEVVSVVWGAPAGSKWRDDERGVDGLWGEVRKAKAQIDLETGASIEPAPAKKESHRKAPVLLSEKERERFLAREDFISDYVNHAKSKVAVLNEPLHRMNAWTLLSLAFAECAYIPKPGAPLYLNLYSMNLAPSTQGKSEAKSMMFQVQNVLFPGDNPDIGGNHSENSLIEQLIERKNKVSFIHADEAHGRFASIKQGGWQMGIVETWTLIYDGVLPQLGRVGRKDLRVTEGVTYPVMHMSGTLSGMYEVLDRTMFLSGYLARQIWVIGNSIELTREHLMPEQVSGDVEKVYERMPRYWASVFFRTRANIRGALKPGQRQMPILMTDEALKRFGDARWQINQHFAQFPDQEVFRPAVNRMNDIIWKAAALLALADGKFVITTEHLLAALGHSEQWFSDMITVAEGISESMFGRAMSEIERHIALAKGEQVEMGAIYRLRGNEPVRVVDDYITTLIKQGRLEKIGGADGAPTYYKIKRARAEG